MLTERYRKFKCPLSSLFKGSVVLLNGRISPRHEMKSLLLPLGSGRPTFRSDLESHMTRHIPRLLLVLQCQLLFLILAPAVSGQIRLHDPANDELAKKTRDAFTEFSKGDANVFDTMVSNTL